MDLVFTFIAAFFVLSACWFTPQAGTEAVYHNYSKPLIVLALVSAAFTGLVGTLL